MALDCERAAPGARVQLAAPAPPARAWLERDSPAESRRLLTPAEPAPAPAKPKSRLQTGLTLGVWTVPRKPAKSLATKYEHPKTKTQTRVAKVIDALRPPYFIFSMIIIMVCVEAGAGGGRAGRALGWWPEGAWWRQPWRLVTYGWVHASGAHVALNALVAAAVGWRLEREQRWWRVGGVWAGGLAAGALGAGACQPHVRVVGASAAVYATLTAHLPNVCFRYGHIPLWWFRPLSVAVLALSEWSWALYGPGLERGPGAGAALEAGRARARVAWEAHLCGALAGVPLAFIFFTGENKSSRCMVAARVASALALSAAVAAAALHYALWHPAPAPAAAHAHLAVIRELTPDHIT